VENQVAVIYAFTNGYTDVVPTDKVKDFEKDFITVLEANHKATIDALKSGKYSDAETDVLKKVATETAEKYKA